MAFNQTTNSKPRNLFTARMVSNNTNATVNFVNITEEFSRKVCGVNLNEMTAEQAEAVLPSLLNNDRVSVVITDTTAEREVISVEDF